MQRRSYYPHNQHLVSTVTATSSGIASSRPGTPANDLRGADGGIAVTGNSVDFNGAESENYRPEHPIPEKNYS
jgi:serine/threonine kinase 32